MTDALKDGDIERKMEEEQRQREMAAELAREERRRKIAFLYDLPAETPAGRMDDFMYKDGVKEVLATLDKELIGLLPVKRRVKEIAALLGVDKMRRKLGFDTSIPSLHMCFTGAPARARPPSRSAWGRFCRKW